MSDTNEPTQPRPSPAATCSASSLTPETPWHAEYLKAADRAMLMECQRDDALRKLETCRESLDDYAETVKNLEDVRDKLRTEIDRLKRELIIAYTPESRDDHDL